MSVWIEIKSDKDLPPEGKYYLCRHNRGTWNDGSDPENVNCVVLKLVKGITSEERGKLPYSDRSRIYKSEDQHGNNLKAYSWSQFGPDDFFGQEITHWTEIPK